MRYSASSSEVNVRTAAIDDKFCEGKIWFCLVLNCYSRRDAVELTINLAFVQTMTFGNLCLGYFLCSLEQDMKMCISFFLV